MNYFLLEEKVLNKDIVIFKVTISLLNKMEEKVLNKDIVTLKMEEKVS